MTNLVGRIYECNDAIADAFEHEWTTVEEVMDLADNNDWYTMGLRQDVRCGIPRMVSNAESKKLIRAEIKKALKSGALEGPYTILRDGDGTYLNIGLSVCADLVGCYAWVTYFVLVGKSKRVRLSSGKFMPLSYLVACKIS